MKKLQKKINPIELFRMPNEKVKLINCLDIDFNQLVGIKLKNVAF